MKRSEALKRCMQELLTAQMNQRYHSAYSNWYRRWDRIVRVLVGVLSVFGLVLTLSNLTSGRAWEVAVSICSLVAAIVLNIIPIGEWDKHHMDLFRRWTNVRKRLESARLAIVKSTADAVNAEMVSLLDEMVRDRSEIAVDEPNENRKFLKLCQEQTKSSMLGDSDKLIDWLQDNYPDLFPQSPSPTETQELVEASS